KGRPTARLLPFLHLWRGPFRLWRGPFRPAIERRDRCDLLAAARLGPLQLRADDGCGAFQRVVSGISERAERRAADDGDRKSTRHFLSHGPHELGANDRRILRDPLPPFGTIRNTEQVAIAR